MKMSLKSKIFPITVLLFIVGFVLLVRNINLIIISANSEIFSDLSLINGINTTRGYGQKLGLSSLTTKILFNKSIYLAIYPLRLASFLFQLVIYAISILFFGHV